MNTDTHTHRSAYKCVYKQNCFTLGDVLMRQSAVDAALRIYLLSLTFD